MFTGIVEELGEVITRSDDHVLVRAQAVLADTKIGDSIAVNGCCLTVVDFDLIAGWWRADVTLETFNRTSLGELKPGSPVNLERPVRLIDRLGGHLVQGHVDAVGYIVEPAPDLCIRMDPAMTRYVVEKGSITVDGISLTVVAALDDGFTVAIIPHTQAVTTLSSKQQGAAVNIEVDITAKYVEKLISWKVSEGQADEVTS
ncbi:MAG: riboflavin synthase [Ilumatobacter sp.]|nr:riboflavin synthase [Ilumatobacter sp.]